MSEGMQAAEAAFDEAATRGRSELVSRAYLVGGRRLGTSVVGRDLAERLNRSWNAFAVSPGREPPLLSIRLWDEAVTQVRLPDAARPERIGSCLPGCRGPIYVTPDARYIVQASSASVLWFDRRRRVMVGSIRKAGEVRADEWHKPFHMLLPTWLSDLGLSLVHAGLVAHRDRGVLIAGPAGGGKSTTALACLQGGFDFFGDDQIAIEARVDGRIIGSRVYGSVAVAAEDLPRFPCLSGIAERERLESGKCAVYPGSAVFREAVASTLIRLVVLPRVGDRTVTSACPARPAEALRRMAPSTLACGLHTGQLDLDRLADLVQRRPCSHLDLGRNRDEIPDRVIRILDGDPQ